MIGDIRLKISTEFRKSVNKRLPDKPGRVIGIVSGKGGVGKTTVSSLLAYAIASKGHSTLVIDMDTGLRNLDIVMGVDNQVVRNLFDVLERKEDFENAAIRAKPGIDAEGNPVTGENLPWICLSDQLKIKNAIAKKLFQELLGDLRNVFDIIILDAPAGIEYGCRLVTESADEAYIVCTPEMPSLRSVDQLSNIFDSRIPVSLIVNRMIPELIENGGGMTLEDIELFTVLPVALAIPFDPGVIAYGHTGRSVWHVKEAPSRIAVADFVDRKFGIIENLQENKVSNIEAETVAAPEIIAEKPADTKEEILSDTAHTVEDNSSEASKKEKKGSEATDGSEGGDTDIKTDIKTEVKTEVKTEEQQPVKKGFWAWLFGK